MNRLIALPLFLLSAAVLAECKTDLPLRGALTVESCEAKAADCELASVLLYRYIQNYPNDPTELSAAMQTSPWHIYDAKQRILSVEEFAATLRPMLKAPIKKVRLIGSWTGVAPHKGGKSLAQKLSQALDGFPVEGMDGFLWVNKDGGLRTTHQAFTLRTISAPYRVKPGTEVMAALASGYLVDNYAHFDEKKDAEGLRLAGLGWDIFVLCPQRALEAYEASAALGNALSAYNAAMLLFERNEHGDKEAGRKWLEKAAQLGDSKAQARLQLLRGEAQPHDKSPQSPERDEQQPHKSPVQVANDRPAPAKPAKVAGED